MHDAMGVARNVLKDPRLVPGGGAVEMAISRGLADRAAALQGAQQVSPPIQPRVFAMLWIHGFACYSSLHWTCCMGMPHNSAWCFEVCWALIIYFGGWQGPYKAVGAALEVIPRTLAQNCGANVIRTLTKLRAKHVEKANCTFGIDGNKGQLMSCMSFIQALVDIAGHRVRILDRVTWRWTHLCESAQVLSAGMLSLLSWFECRCDRGHEGAGGVGAF